MQKYISILLTIMLLLTNFFPVAADTITNDTKVDLKKAIQIAKNSFDLDTEGYEFNQNYHETTDGISEWYLNWNKADDNISISVDANTGDINHMNTWKPIYNDPPKISKYKREDAVKAADKVLKKLHPVKYQEMKLLELTPLNPGYEYDSYNIQYVRQAKGIPFPGNGVNIGIDKNTLELKNYNFTWYRGDLPDCSKAINMEKGKKAFNDNNDLKLTYIIRYDNKSKLNKAILVYNLKNGNRPIDAITGEPIKDSYYGFKEMGMGGAGGMTMAEDEKSLTPEEIKATEDVSKYISKEKALKIGEKYVFINEKQSLSYASLYNYQDGRNPRWNFSWDYSNPKEEEYAYSSISIDAITGEILNFYKGDSALDKLSSQGKPKYTMEQCKNLAESFLKEISPDKYTQTEYKNMEKEYENIDKPRNYQFDYERIVNGITCIGNGLSVTVNNFTGDITNYNNNWNDIDFPKPIDTLSLSNAYKKLYKNIDFKLQFINHYDYELKRAKNTVRLVYMFESFSGMIDSKTGEVLDYNGEAIKSKDEETFDDIKGHWAENDIIALIDAGILKVESKKFHPDEKVKQKDFVKILINSLQPYYNIKPLTIKSESPDEEYEKYYKQAIARNIISEEEKDLNAVVTRIEGAKFFVNAMDLGYLAKKTEIFSIRFNDGNEIADELKGYAAIASGLEIMTGNNGYFFPLNAVTNAETAAMIVKFLTK